MNCAYCGTPLPAGALFCVECGRSVAEPPPAVREPARVPLPPAAIELHAPHCPQCGTAIEDGDIFCGECGFVLRPITAAVPVVERAAPAEEPGPAVAPEVGVADELVLDEGEAEPELDAQPEVEPEPGSAVEEIVAEPLADWSEDRAVPTTAFLGLVEPPAPAAPPAAPAVPSSSAHDAHPLEDIETTRIVGRRAKGESYVLQFSTGESVTVSGTGLIGRNPSPEPGEYVDELVPIFDVGKSVSKSHVEFGQEGGRFWVADRYSTNGTVIRQPDAEPVRCEPGKRYMIARGSRVEIGEQFFVVS